MGFCRYKLGDHVKASLAQGDCNFKIIDKKEPYGDSLVEIIPKFGGRSRRNRRKRRSTRRRR